MSWACLSRAGGSLARTTSLAARHCSSHLLEKDLLLREAPDLSIKVGQAALFGQDMRGGRSRGSVRHRALGDLVDKVNRKADCWAYNIHNLVFLIKNDGLVTSEEADALLRACTTDILDLMPGEQRQLTELAWDTVTSSTSSLPQARLPRLYANMLRAFTFQNIPVDIEQLKVELKQRKVEWEHSLKVAMIDQLCREGRVAEAWTVQEEGRGVVMSESLANSFIFGHARLGQMDLAENVLKSLNFKNIYWGHSCYEAFVLGCARAGDLERMDFFLHKLKTPSDQVVLAAVLEMSREHAHSLDLLLELEPRDREVYSANCRRTVKTLVEADHTEAAWRLVRKTRQHKLINSDKERVIKVCPSVIVVTRLLADSSCVETVMGAIQELVEADPKIVSRTVAVAIDVCSGKSSQLAFCKELIEHITATFPEEREAIKDLVGQSSKRLMRVASASDSEEEVYAVFRLFSHLGLKLEGKGRSGSARGWDLLLNRLLPTIPLEGAWTERSLQEQCWAVKDSLAKCHGGLYSHSVVWGSVMQHLLNRENELFFRVAAGLSKELHAAYAPKRWVLSLANCLLKLEDVTSFVDILEVVYKNSLKRGDLSDLEVTTEALLHFLARGERQGGRSTERSQVLRVHQVLIKVLDEVWERKVQLPRRARDKLRQTVWAQGHKGLASAVDNIPAVEMGPNGKVVLSLDVQKRPKPLKDVQKRPTSSKREDFNPSTVLDIL